MGAKMLMHATVTTLDYANLPVVAFDLDGLATTMKRPADEPSQDELSQKERTVIGAVHAVTSKYAAADPGMEFATHFEKLDAVANTPALWPEGVEGPTDVVYKGALEALQQLQEDEVAPSRVVASAEGGIAICFVLGDKYADLEFLNTGEVLGVTTSRHDRPVVWEIGEGSDKFARASARISRFLNV